ncbi:MAG: hypothetical protein K2M30_00660 [Desulfovibrionaceae bacterium]|nr:hypothetical protein [Desulfovibrionaceae bacterium]
MNTIFEELCIQHESNRFVEQYDYYNTLTDKERLYIKSSIAFVYEYYTEQYQRICEYTSRYTTCTLQVTKKPATFLLALLPSTISLPPLISLLLPVQILRIPTIINFQEIPSPYTLTAIELLGIEDIFIGAGTSLSQAYTGYDGGINITSEGFNLPHSIWHYTPPLLPEEASHIDVHKWLYPDAIYTETTKAHVSHTIKESISHLWIYPSISLDCYYSIDYIMR